MAKKVLVECSKCGRINEAKIGFFHSSKLRCHCGHMINVNNERMVTKQCKNCGNIITYDKVKNEFPVCPVCHNSLKEEKEDWKFVEIVCDDCSSHLIVNKEEESTTCPICGNVINIKKMLELQSFKEEKQPIILKGEGDISVVAIKHKLEDFPLFSQILVNESQKGVFISNGKVEAIYGAGSHRVDFASEILSKDNAYNKDLTFKSKLYFVSTNVFSNNKWGTDSKVRLLDPASNMHIELGAYGVFNFKISDVAKFLFDFIGISNVNEKGYKIDDLLEKLKPLIISNVKTLLPKVIKEHSINILEIDENLSLIAKDIKETTNLDLAKFGIELTDFIILNVATPEDDPNYKKLVSQYAEKYLKVKDENIKEEEAKAAYNRKKVEANTENELAIEKAKTEAQIAKIKAEAEAESYYLKAHAEANEMKEKGYTYNDVTKREVSKEVAQSIASNGENKGSDNEFSHLAAESFKANVIKDIGKAMSNDLLSGIVDSSNLKNNNTWKCQICGKEDLTSNFCPNCGNKKPE